MAPPGKHVMSCFVQYAPYHLDPSLGTWDDNREAFGDAVVDRIAEFAPDLQVEDPPPQRPDAARHRADDRPQRGQHLPGRALARAALLQPAGARLGPLPDPGPRPLAVRLRHPPGRRDHGRQRPDRGDGAPPVARKAGGVMAADGRAEPRPRPAPGTPSSSAAATTPSSPRPTSRRAACGRSSSSGASGSAARRTRASSRRASASRRSPTPSAGCGRRSTATST